MIVLAMALMVAAAPCSSCHGEMVESYRQTAHARTSNRAGADTIRGSFEEGKNMLRTHDNEVYFRMERRGDGFYQTAFDHGKTRSERFDLALGSGRRGQSYLFLQKGVLYQLPVSYAALAGGWVNSPGYEDGKVYFNRRIPPSCMQCHSTASGDKLLPGITCQKCHGTAEQHPGIVDPAHSNREGRIAVCAACHSGLDSDPKADVHGNQVGLLRRSRCFENSPEMSCLTCHNVHRVERDLVALSAKCIACHTGQGGRVAAHLADKTNCIDCHMPRQDSQGITFRTAGRSLAQTYRTHTIGIY
jgi:hypothetical protein